MMKVEVSEEIHTKFPGVRVLMLDGSEHFSMYGLGVELNGQRNACAFNEDTPENWRTAADRLLQWLQGISEG